PAGMQTVIVSLSMIVLTAIINTFGSTVVAAFGAASRFDQFAILPALSVGFAVTALVGQNLGAQKHERVKEIVRYSMLLSAAITGLVTILVLVVPRPFLAIFTTDAGVIGEGANYLR